MMNRFATLLAGITLAHLLGACSSSSSGESDDDEDTIPSPTIASQVVLSELMANPFVLSDSDGEWIEVHNPGTSKYNLKDCVISDADTNNYLIASNLVIDGGEFLTFASSAIPGFTPDISYAGSGLILNNTGDTVTLTCNSVTIDTVTFAALNAGESYMRNGNVGTWCQDDMTSYNGDFGTPGASNVPC